MNQYTLMMLGIGTHLTLSSCEQPGDEAAGFVVPPPPRATQQPPPEHYFFKWSLDFEKVMQQNL